MGDKRPETGAMVFGSGSDWPGIFIRGDNAFGLRIMLEDVLSRINNPQEKITDVQKVNDDRELKELIELLKSCNCSSKDFNEKGCQRLKDFDECILEKKKGNKK